MSRCVGAAACVRWVCLWLVATAMGATAAESPGVGGLGRVVPKGGIANLVGPAASRVERVHVRRGQQVAAGDLLVTFAAASTLETETAMAEAAVAQAEATARQAVALQELEVALREHEQQAAQRQLQRVEAAGGESFSPRQLEESQNGVFVADNRLAAARLQLESARQDGRSAVARARRELELARDRLQQAVLRAPFGGTVVALAARPGGPAGSEPLVRLANLDTLYVECDVFEAELRRLAPGMRATVNSGSVPGPLEGVVEDVGVIIDPRSQMGQVLVRLLDPAAVRGLLHLQANVTIHPTP
jgi:multidrug resistance efflux pump